MRFEAKLTLPPVLNRAYGVSRSGTRYKTVEAKAWEKEAGWTLREQMKRTGLIGPFYAPTDPLYLGVDIFLDHDRDIDASLKLLLDLLQMPKGKSLGGIGVIHDDKDIFHLNVRKFKDPNPRIELVIDKLSL